MQAQRAGFGGGGRGVAGACQGTLLRSVAEAWALTDVATEGHTVGEKVGL